jgi:hypothetical protein
MVKSVKSWSGRRDSNPRPRPWQGRALPLSYTRIRAIGGDEPPATGRAMPNAALECNSPRMARNRPDDGLSATMPKDSPKTASERPPTLLYWTFWAGNLADWRIPELHYEGDLARPSAKADFQLPGISSALPFSNLRTLRRCLTRSSGKARTGREGAVPARNHLPTDCKSDFQPPIRPQPVLEQAQSARHQTRIP